MEDLESVALDLTLWTPEVSAAPKQTRRPYNNPKYGVNDVDKAEQLCMNKREGKPCRQGSECPFGHDGFTGNICTDAEYLSTAWNMLKIQ